jgi:hypothetical protein
MRTLAVTAIVTSLINASAWAADPVGSYRVNGSNPHNGGSYSGTVTVEKTGQTYKVTWVFADQTTHVGTGIGNDHFIAVSYHSDNMTGLALYGERAATGRESGRTKAGQRLGPKTGLGSSRSAMFAATSLVLIP